MRREGRGEIKEHGHHLSSTLEGRLNRVPEICQGLLNPCCDGERSFLFSICFPFKGSVGLSCSIAPPHLVPLGGVGAVTEFFYSLFAAPVSALLSAALF